MKFYVLILAFCAGVLNTAQAEKITYARHIRPIFQDNCFKCHNPDKEKGGLNLTTMSAVMVGGGSGQVVVPGDPDDSLLYLQMTHAEEPFMPPKSSKRPDAELALVRQWIEGGLLETDSSVARVAKRPSAAVAQADVSLDRPEGPAPMPVDLPLEPVHVLQRADAIVALAANPWAPVTAAGSENQVLLHHSGTRDLVGVLPFPEGAIYDVRFSRNGQLLLVAGGAAGKDGAVVIFDARSGERLVDLRVGYDAVLSADVSADQRDVVIGGTDRLIRIFDAASGEERHKIKKHTEWVTSVAYSPDGVLLATGDRNGNLYVWEAGTLQEFYALKGHSGQITELAWRRDSNMLASVSEDGTIRLWSMHNGREARKWKSHGDGVLAIDYFPDGRLVTCGRDHKVRIWDGNGKEQKAISVDALPLQVTAGTDNKTVVVGSFDGTLQVADVSGTVLGSLDSVPPKIETRLRNARASLAPAQTIAQKNEAHVAQLDNDQKESLANRDTRQKARDTARSALAMSVNSLAAVEGLLASNDGTMSEARKQAAAARAVFEESERALEAANLKRNALLKEIEGLIQELASVPTNLPDVSLSAKHQEVDATKALVETTTQSQHLARESLQSAEAALGRRDEEHAGLRQKADEGRQQVTHLDAEAAEYEAVLKTAEAKLAELNEKRPVALKERDASRAAAMALQAEVARWEAAKFNLGVHAARAALREKESVLRAHEASLDQARSTLEGATTEVSKQKAELEELQTKFNAMKADKAAAL